MPASYFVALRCIPSSCSMCFILYGDQAELPLNGLVGLQWCDHFQVQISEWSPDDDDDVVWMVCFINLLHSVFIEAQIVISYIFVISCKIQQLIFHARISTFGGWKRSKHVLLRFSGSQIWEVVDEYNEQHWADYRRLKDAWCYSAHSEAFSPAQKFQIHNMSSPFPHPQFVY